MKTMLIAVGSDVIRKALAEAFQTEYRVSTCRRGQQALLLLSQAMPDILILDLFLPEINGISLLQQTDHTPPQILALTYLTTEDIIQAAQDSGIQTLLRLPCSVSHVQSKIHQIMASAQDTDLTIRRCGE